MNNSSVYDKVIGTARDLADYWRTARTACPGTYGPRVARFLSWAIGKELPPAPEAVRGWLDHLDKAGRSASYLAGNFFAIRSALLLWLDHQTRQTPRSEAELILWSFEKDMKTIKLPTVVRGKRAEMVAEFRAEQLDRVIRGATRRISAYIEFIADTGVRVSEMTGIRMSKIQRRAVKSEDGIPFDLVSIVGKGAKERAIFVPSSLIDRMVEVFHGSSYLFETATGRPVDPDNVYREIRRTFQRLEGIVITPHNLRHWYATSHIEDGDSPKAVAHNLGHASVSTTLTSYDASRMKLARLVKNHHGDRGKTIKPKNAGGKKS